MVGLATWFRLATAIAVVGVVGTVMQCGAHLLVTPLEARVARVTLADDDQYDGIIVLGGGFERFVEAVKLAGRFPTAKLVLAGKGEQTAHDYVLARGVDATRVVLETDSRTTYENAVFAKERLAPHAGSRWLLVTSAAHMPRAIGSFRKAGFAVHPWPTLRPSHSSTAQVARHEWFGLFAYRLLGRTDSIFPRHLVSPASLGT
jgi:uncharacterized SAM-binding protein YcdF (DUF218 family)